MAFTLLFKRAKMPSSCRGSYMRIGLIEHEAGYRPSQIRNTTKTRIYQTWERLNVGSTDRCAFAVARKEAEALLIKLQKGE